MNYSVVQVLMCEEEGGGGGTHRVRQQAEVKFDNHHLDTRFTQKNLHQVEVDQLVSLSSMAVIRCGKSCIPCNKI